jgi:hypothetical protein
LSYVNKEDTNKASLFYDSAATRLLINKDTVQAIEVLRDKALKLSDGGFSRSDVMLSRLLRDRYRLALLKVDIFYVDKSYEEDNSSKGMLQEMYSVDIADALLRTLSPEPNYVVRKRLIHPKQTSRNPYVVENNEIRYDKNGEREYAEKLYSKISSSPRLKNIPFVRKSLSDRGNNNYISIIIKNK